MLPPVSMGTPELNFCVALEIQHPRKAYHHDHEALVVIEDEDIANEMAEKGEIGPQAILDQFQFDFHKAVTARRWFHIPADVRSVCFTAYIDGRDVFIGRADINHSEQGEFGIRLPAIHCPSDKIRLDEVMEERREPQIASDIQRSQAALDNNI